MSEIRFQPCLGVLLALAMFSPAVQAQQKTAYGEKVKSPGARTQPGYGDV
jgi:hypothetical protein